MPPKLSFLTVFPCVLGTLGFRLLLGTCLHTKKQRSTSSRGRAPPRPSSEMSRFRPFWSHCGQPRGLVGTIALNRRRLALRGRAADGRPANGQPAPGGRCPLCLCGGCLAIDHADHDGQKAWHQLRFCHTWSRMLRLRRPIFRSAIPLWDGNPRRKCQPGTHGAVHTVHWREEGAGSRRI